MVCLVTEPILVWFLGFTSPSIGQICSSCCYSNPPVSANTVLAPTPIHSGKFGGSDGLALLIHCFDQTHSIFHCYLLTHI